MTKIILIIKNNSYHYLNLNRNLSMHLRYLLPALAIAGAHAEKATDLATADAYHMQYNFGPPPVITPQTDINAPLENQFDYARPWLDPNVANDVAGSTTRPLQLGAQIGSHGDSERALLRLRGSNGYLIGNASTSATTKTAAAHASTPATPATAKRWSPVSCQTVCRNTVSASYATASTTTNSRAIRWMPCAPAVSSSTAWPALVPRIRATP